MSRRADPTGDQLEKWLAEEHAYRLRQLTYDDCKWDADSLTSEDKENENKR